MTISRELATPFRNPIRADWLEAIRRAVANIHCSDGTLLVTYSDNGISIQSVKPTYDVPKVTYGGGETATDPFYCDFLGYFYKDADTYHAGTWSGRIVNPDGSITTHLSIDEFVITESTTFSIKIVYSNTFSGNPSSIEIGESLGETDLSSGTIVLPLFTVTFDNGIPSYSTQHITGTINLLGLGAGNGQAVGDFAVSLNQTETGWAWSCAAGSIINPDGSKTSISEIEPTNISSSGTIKIVIEYSGATPTATIGIVNDTGDLTGAVSKIVIDLVTITFVSTIPLLTIHYAGSINLAGKVIPSSITAWDNTSKQLLTSNAGTMTWVTVDDETSADEFTCPAEE